MPGGSHWFGVAVCLESPKHGQVLRTRRRLGEADMRPPNLPMYPIHWRKRACTGKTLHLAWPAEMLPGRFRYWGVIITLEPMELCWSVSASHQGPLPDSTNGEFQRREKQLDRQTATSSIPSLGRSAPTVHIPFSAGWPYCMSRMSRLRSQPMLRQAHQCSMS